MSIRSDLRTYLQSKSEITDIVANRIFPVVLPEGFRPAQNNQPAITYSRVTAGHEHVAKGSAGNAIPIFELVCWGNYDAADNLAEALRLVMQGFDGPMGTTSVQSCIYDDETDGYEDAADGSDDGDYTITLRYRIRYVAALPTP